MRFINPIEITDSRRESTNAIDEVVASYNAGTTYSVNAQVKYGHSIYESRVGSNTGNRPDLFPDKWRFLKPLNSWAMFDSTVETQTSAADQIVVELETGLTVNALALLNLVGNWIRVRMIDADDGVVYDRTVQLVSTAGITNFWRWLFYPIERTTDLVLLDLPSYASATLEITIDNEGNDAKCGVCAVGMLKQIGEAQYGTSVGIVDYSKIKEDEFGNRMVVKRSYAKRMKVPIALPRGTFNYAVRTLSQFRQVNVVWIASEEYEPTIIFGPYKSFEAIIERWGMQRCDLEIQGLI